MREWLTGVQITNDQIQVVGAEVLKHGRAMSEAKGGWLT